MLSSLFSSRKELMLENLRWRRSLSFKAELKMFDDLIDGFVVFDEGDNSHLASATRV
jgi:hypothetical protein